MDTPTKEDHDDLYERFLHLLVQNQRNIFGFILSMVPQHSVAEDLLQETIMVMWRKFSTFQSGTNFKAWAFQIAKLHILKWREKSKNNRVKFSTEALESIDIVSKSDSFKHEDDLLEALKDCMEKLNVEDKCLIEMRYFDRMKIKQIALTLKRPIHGMYKTMARVHHLLCLCISEAIPGQ